MPLATVLIPTYDHHDTILRAVRSVEGQTIQDYEILIIGDGVSTETKALLEGLCDKDQRVRYIPHPKGPRTGEIYRHQALQNVDSKFICYLADDDLWLPNHLEVMLEASSKADFFHTLHTGIEPGGKLYFLPSDLTNPDVVEMMCQTKTNRFGLSFAGHTLDAYRALPHGWRTAPEGMHTDLHMWRQFLQEQKLRCETIFRITALNFAAPARKTWTHEQRLEELDHWLTRIDQDDFADEIYQHLITHAAVTYSSPQSIAAAQPQVKQNRKFRQDEKPRPEPQTEVSRLNQELRHLNNTLTERDAEIASLQQQNSGLNIQMENLLASTSWRITAPMRWIKHLLKKVGI